eukprot:PhF_6_TR30405/c0_g1_i1/m.44589
MFRIRYATRALFVAWAVLFIYVEIIQYDSFAASCSNHLQELNRANPTQLTIGIIGDPQLTDFYSYKQTTSISLLSTEFISDLYMRKNFRRYQKMMDVVLFTGDLFDGGRVATSDQFLHDLNRFEHVFRTDPPKKLKVTVSGNHDVGYAAFEEERVLERFEATFGATHEVYTFSRCAYTQFQYWMKNDSRTDGAGEYRTCTSSKKPDLPLITLILLNSQFVDADPNSRAHKETLKFLTEAVKAVDESGAPAVLALHMPLYRRRVEQCGGLRTKEEIPSKYEKIMDGDHPQSYQNYVSKVHSEHLLHTVMPKIIISGHDHDHCKYEHNGVSTEYTIGTFSWLQGNRYPSVSFLLLDSRGVLSVTTCAMPNQYISIYLYVGLGVLGLLLQSLSYRQKQHVEDADKAKANITLYPVVDTLVQFGVVVCYVFIVWVVVCNLEWV